MLLEAGRRSGTISRRSVRLRESNEEQVDVVPTLSYPNTGSHRKRGDEMSEPALPVRRTRTRRGEATRRQLLDSAIKLVATLGYGSTTVQNILDDTGLSKGSLLHQFGNREALMVATAEAAAEAMLRTIEEDFGQYSRMIDGMRNFPDILWRVENDLPARALAEIQLAARWDQGLALRLQAAFLEVEAVLAAKIRKFCELEHIHDPTALTCEIHLLITGTQGLVMNQSLVSDLVITEGARRILRDRFVSALTAAALRQAGRSG